MLKTMWFHASREILEHPTTLIDALHTDGISVRIDEPFRAIGHVDDLDICVQLYSKRFYSNLSIHIRLSPSSSAELKRIVSEAKKDEADLIAVLRILGEQHKMTSDVADRISAVLAKINITVVDSPIEAELNFVRRHAQTSSKLEEMISTIREQQELVSRSVSAQQFEDAARYRDERVRLMDALYDFCTKDMKSV